MHLFAAIDGGESIDTSMGFTPLAGVTMGTRSGNLDPALIPFIMEKTGKTADEVLEILNKESGLLGLTGTSSDLRDLTEEAKHGRQRPVLLWIYLLQKFTNILVLMQLECMV